MTILPCAGDGSCLYQASIKSLDNLKNQDRSIEELTKAAAQLREDVMNHSLQLLASDLPQHLALFQLDQRNLRKKDIKHHRSVISDILKEWKFSNLWIVQPEPEPKNEKECYICQEVFQREISFQRHKNKGHTDMVMAAFKTRVSRAPYLFLSDKIPILLCIYLQRPLLIFRKDQSLNFISIHQFRLPGVDLGEIYPVLLEHEHYSGLSLKNHFRNLLTFLQEKIDVLDAYVSAGQLRKLYHAYASSLPQDIQKKL